MLVGEVDSVKDEDERRTMITKSELSENEHEGWTALIWVWLGQCMDKLPGSVFDFGFPALVLATHTTPLTQAIY